MSPSTARSFESATASRSGRLGFTTTPPADGSDVDVEGLRLHYARTCRQWVERLCARADEARALAGERTYRTWRLYLTCSAVAFEGGSLGLYQVLMRKHRDPRVGLAPRTREPLYERGPA